MRLDVYLAETHLIAEQQGSILDDTAERLRQGATLTPLEQNGVLHALQVLVENSIGKAKNTLKSYGKPVPVSAYDAIKEVGKLEQWDAQQLERWRSIIGLRNKIVHEYMNIDMDTIQVLVRERHYNPIITYLLSPIVKK
ncbi:DUF86 domain-containing protein [Salinispirillum sp. LH 10-3-1]|uniref:DUF86 domain-containing protein n=1 Tax=Salinispirillum sp. LH 10-3-1 TaxID=2952525 RepID=A0AB38YD96_9GAMM